MRFRHSNRNQHQPTYPIVTVQYGGYCDEGPLGQYKSFLEEGLINMNIVDAEYYKMSGEEVNYHIIGVVLSQKFILMAALKKFGKPGGGSSVKEMTQIHYMTTLVPLDPKKLTIEDIIKALSSLMFLLEKQDGTIKARTFYDVISQIRDDTYNNHYYNFPTCENNSVMITSSLESKKGRDVAIIDIPGTCLHTCVDKHGKQIIIMLFKGK